MNASRCHYITLIPVNAIRSRIRDPQVMKLLHVYLWPVDSFLVAFESVLPNLLESTLLKNL